MNYFPRRYFMVSGTFALALLVLVDRACIQLAKDQMTGELGLSDKQFGWILSIFALGYALFQTPAGILADRYGPRKVLSAVVTLWSVFTALTGAAFSYVYLLIVRFLFGMGEAGAFPGMARSIYSWIPLKERGLVNGINFSGGRIGVAIFMPVFAWLFDAFGWRLGFVFLGITGILFAFIWYLLFRDDPLEHNGITKAEKQFIEANRQNTDSDQKSVEKLNYSSMLKSKNMWLLMGQYFASNFTFFFCLTWLYPYLKETYNLATLEAGYYTSLPFFAGALGNWVSGWLVDYFYKTKTWKLSRLVPAILGFSLASIGLVVSLQMSTALGAVLLLSLAVFGADMTLSPSWSLCVDIGQKNSGAVSGTMNMAGNIGSFVTALAFPYLNAWFNSTTPFFYLGASLNLLAIIFWFKLSPEIPIEKG